jgi:hypothetical protein
LSGRLPYPLGVVYSVSAGDCVARHGRRNRAVGGEGGQGRAHIGDDVEVADLVAKRQVGMVVGKRNNLLGFKGFVQALHGG